MRIIQSFWSKPFSGKEESDRNLGGWLELNFFYYAWALSCLKFRQFNNEVVLFTDNDGKRILIDELKLPYTKTYVELDQLNHYNSKLWAIGKLYTYSRQDQPFIHADGDFIPFKPFTNSFLKSNILIQSREWGERVNELYRPVLDFVRLHLNDVPEEIINPATPQFESANFGIIGGHDLKFFKDYCRTAFNFIDKNLNSLDRIEDGAFNSIAEQYLFYQMALRQGRQIKFLWPSISPSFEDFVRFHMLPNLSGHIHVAGPYKQDLYVATCVERSLRRFYPDVYDLINSFLGISSSLPEDDFSKEKRLEKIRKTSIPSLRFRLSRKYDFDFEASNNRSIKLRYTKKMTNHSYETIITDFQRNILEYNANQWRSLSDILDFVNVNYKVNETGNHMRDGILSFMLYHWYSKDTVEISLN
jgi:hypothetical protein